MACLTAPIDIVVNTQTEKLCKLKCSYQFTYPTTSLQIYNGGEYLLMTPDQTATPPVIYNDNNYNVTLVVLISPSVHTFAGKKADAELIIMHQKVNSQKYLNVCVPIKASSKTTDDSATFFDLIIGETSQTAPTGGDHTVFIENSFSLKSMVPLEPYYSYTGSSLLFKTGMCEYIEKDPTKISQLMNIDYIVYHLDNAITMSPQALRTLNRLIGPYTDVVSVPESRNPGGIFFNPRGPVPPVSGEIYIDCRPTGADGEILVTARQDSGGLLNNATLKKMWNYTFMKIIIGAVVMLLIWKLSMKAITGIATNSSRMEGGAGAAGAGPRMKGGARFKK